MATIKNLIDLFDAQDILLSAVSDFYSGKTFAYKTISTELRKLLCDTKRKKDISILGTVFPDLKIRAISGYSLPAFLQESTIFSLPMQIDYDGKGGIRCSLSLDRNAIVSRTDWLDQPLVNSKVTVGKFIKAVADTEGAHSDPSVDTLLHNLAGVVIGKEPTYQYLIVAIGEYIALVVDEICKSQQLRKKYEHQRPKNILEW